MTARGFLPVGEGITRQESVQVYVNLPVLLESEINKQASASQLKGDQRTPCYESGMCVCLCVCVCVYIYIYILAEIFIYKFDSYILYFSFFLKDMDGIVKIAWVPPELVDAVACVCVDGTLSLWEEVAEDAQPLQWKLCTSFNSRSAQLIDTQFGVSPVGLKMVTAYSDARVKFYELMNPLELKNWQLQAEFHSVIDSVSTVGHAICILYLGIHKGKKSQESIFVLGFNLKTPQLNFAAVWEFDQAHQRWLPVAELASPGDNGDQVYAVAWAPNIGRSYEVIDVATHKGISIWHIGLNPDLDGRLSLEKIALLSGHKGKVWQMEWDMSGMMLAATGNDGAVRLWQSSLNGVWHEEATFEPLRSPSGFTCYCGK